MHQEGQGIHPKIPYRPQRRGAERKEQHYAPGQPRQHKQPQLSLGPIQGEKKDGPGAEQTVQAVQWAAEPGEPQPDGPQQIVPHA